VKNPRKKGIPTHYWSKGDLQIKETEKPEISKWVEYFIVEKKSAKAHIESWRKKGLVNSPVRHQSIRRPSPSHEEKNYSQPQTEPNESD